MKSLPFDKVIRDLQKLIIKVDELVDQDVPLDRETVCHILGISRKTLSNKMAKGEIPFHKSAIGTYFFISEINKTIKNNKKEIAV